MITNVWDLRRPRAVSHREVVEAASAAAPLLGEVIAAWLGLP